MAKAKKIGKVDRTYSEQSVYGRTTSTAKIPVKLQLEDGKYFGDVSYDAYQAIKGNRLDSYTPSDEAEKKVLDQYKKYINSKILKSNIDGTEFGVVSDEALAMTPDGETCLMIIRSGIPDSIISASVSAAAARATSLPL